MKYHARFLHIDSEGKLVDALGSNAVFVLDGRKSLQNMIDDAHAHKSKMKAVAPHFVGFKVMRGARFDNCQEVYRCLHHQNGLIKVYRTLSGSYTCIKVYRHVND